MLWLENLAVGYGDLALLKGINLLLRHGQRVALIGPNGSGKTTLLRTICAMLPPLEGGIHLGSRIKVGYMAQEHEHLDPRLNSLETLRQVMPDNETAIRSFLSKYLFTGDDVFTPAGSLSFGERARLTLALLVAQGCNFLLLDEPVNHLDIPARARFEQALGFYEGSVLAVTHDRYFIDAFATHLWEVQGDSVSAR